MNRAKEIFIKAKKNVFNSNLGLYESLIKGDGLDFREIKEYENEDLRRINYKASAKSGELKANVFNETKQMNVVVVLALSSSLKFGSSRLKLDLAAEVFTLLALATTMGRNLLFPVVFSNKPELFYEPVSDENEIYEITKDILNLNTFKKEIDFKKLSEFLNSVIKRKTAVFLISDFLEEIDLSEISYQNDVYAVVLRDFFEENLTTLNDVDLINPFNGDKFEANLDEISIKRYKKLLKTHDEKLKEHFLQNKVSFGKIYTNDEPLSKLIQIARR